MGKLVANIIVEIVRDAGVQRCYGVMSEEPNPIARPLKTARLSGCR
jgi:hypothetical protein